MLPCRQSLKPGTPFKRDTELDEVFDESKSVIIDETEEGVRIFDKYKAACILVDWSKTGIGFWLSSPYWPYKSRHDDNTT